MKSIDEFQEKETKTENQVGFIMSLAWDCIHVALFLGVLRVRTIWYIC